MIGRLLWKDLLRVRRNPLPYLIQLAIPLCITGVIGLAFAPKEDGSAIAAIKVAVVDEDATVLSSLLKGSFNQGEGSQYIDPRIVDREEAMKLIEANRISAVVVIPEGFMAAYLDEKSPPALELIKNPAQSFYPAVIEELMAAAVELLNALTRTLGPELTDLIELIDVKEGERVSLLNLAALMIRLEEAFVRAEDYLFPPLIGYDTEERLKEARGEEAGFSIFSFILAGLAAMFMLFLASIAITDLFEELKGHTLARIRTLCPSVLPVVVGKVVLSGVVLLIGAFILFVGGGYLFGITWHHPWQIAILCLAYSLFCAGLMAFIASLAGDEHRMNVVGNIVIFGQAFVGGTMVPVGALPSMIREYISPYTPLHWFTGSIRALENGVEGVSWIPASAKLGVGGVILILGAIILLDRFVSKGARS